MYLRSTQGSNKNCFSVIRKPPCTDKTSDLWNVIIYQFVRNIPKKYKSIRFFKHNVFYLFRWNFPWNLLTTNICYYICLFINFYKKDDIKREAIENYIYVQVIEINLLSGKPFHYFKSDLSLNLFSVYIIIFYIQITKRNNTKEREGARKSEAPKSRVITKFDLNWRLFFYLTPKFRHIKLRNIPDFVISQ